MGSRANVNAEPIAWLEAAGSRSHRDLDPSDGILAGRRKITAQAKDFPSSLLLKLHPHDVFAQVHLRCRGEAASSEH